MDSNILWIMLCIVGITELIKGFFKSVPKWLSILLTIFVGVCVSCLYIFLPNYWDKIRVVLVSISGATVFYDTVLKTFQKRLTNDSNEDKVSGNTDNAETTR